MTPIEQQILDLQAAHQGASATKQASGAYLIEIPKYKMPHGWSHDEVMVIFLAPPGFPASQPDCFWLESEKREPIRLKGGGTPQASNDTNPVPGIGQRGTWFSWHLQRWDPNRDSLLRYLRVIEQRLYPPR